MDLHDLKRERCQHGVDVVHAGRWLASLSA